MPPAVSRRWRRGWDGAVQGGPRKDEPSVEHSRTTGGAQHLRRLTQTPHRHAGIRSTTIACASRAHPATSSASKS